MDTVKSEELKDRTARGWMLTLNAEEYPKEEVEEKLSKYSYIGQLEKGEENEYLHWQVYIENKTQIRFSTLKSKFPKGHFEIRKGTKEACYAYVTKSETGMGVGIRNGEIALREKTPGGAEELNRLRTLLITGEKTLNQILIEEQSAAKHLNYLKELDHTIKSEKARGRFRDVEVTYIFGETGVGKTKHVYDLYKGNYEQLYVVGNYSHPFDSYDNQDCLVLDEFAGQLDFEYLLKILDRYPIELRARYRDKVADFTKVFILSNLTLDECYRDIYTERPSQWKALLRRIGHYYEMDSTGKLTECSKPGS